MPSSRRTRGLTLCQGRAVYNACVLRAEQSIACTDWWGITPSRSFCASSVGALMNRPCTCKRPPSRQSPLHAAHKRSKSHHGDSSGQKTHAFPMTPRVRGHLNFSDRFCHYVKAASHRVPPVSWALCIPPVAHVEMVAIRHYPLRCAAPQTPCQPRYR